MLTPDQFLLGIALIVLIAVGCQIAASRLRIPALILLLPAGFTAGALTDVVHPDKLAPGNFSSIVSLSVAVILYDAGLGLRLAHLRGAIRSVVLRLLFLGVLASWASVTALAPALLGVPFPVALLLGAVLVVSGPTVVGPLLDHVRPPDRVRRILIWEGTLVDPVGAILGALVLHSLLSGDFRVGRGFHLGEFMLSWLVGLAGGAVGAAVLWFLLRRLRLGETLGTLAQLATVVAVSAGCDIVRDDTGLIAAVVAGLAVANLPGLGMPVRRPFFETLVQLIIGLLFVTISAGVAPSSVLPVLLPALGLVGALVLVVRPLVAWISTHGHGLPRGERLFIAWMAPRGIVAASTASAFASTLDGEGLPGTDAILPVTFLVIVGTVLVYGLTAAPVAARLGITLPTRARPLLVGGRPWSVDLARCLKSAGLDVTVWTATEEQRQRVRHAGIEPAPGELLTAATDPSGRLEGVTSVLLLTDDDDFNALVSVVAQDSVDGPVHRVGPPPHGPGAVATRTGPDVLFGPGLGRDVLADRHGRGARFTVGAPGECPPPGHDALFVLGADGRLEPVTESRPARPGPGDRVVLLGPAPGGTPA
ncbi:sodium:proton exchanger [Streptomyces sp. ICN441]|uniref:cation:proton antiporter n=1 Tax=Streptomyces sp. ICN441 TaxID=2558286 RepID=UPI00106D3E8B|nr:cation:proton antiporter [Streptomyces sp. ICN441]TFE52337.1 sodium:proton exchanger [Streptomyces sp. ICN441]